MDKLPQEIIAHILSFSSGPDATKNCRSTCKTLYQFLMAQKSHFIIKAMPASEFEALLAIMKRSKKQIELTMRAPTLSLQRIQYKLMNYIYSSLKNMTGLDLSEWDLAQASHTKLIRLTNLQRLSIRSTTINLSPLSNLTKLECHYNVPAKVWSSLTNLQDLIFHNARPDQTEALTCLSNLTRLHIIYAWWYQQNMNELVLTTLSKLKDLNVSPAQRYFHPKIKLIASCTTLESLYIINTDDEVDVNWISLNTKLTSFNVRYKDILSDDHPEKFHPLTKLTNLTSAFMNRRTAHLFGENQKINTLRIDHFNTCFANIIKYSTALESLETDAYDNKNDISFGGNITKLICSNCFSPPPLNLKVLKVSNRLGDKMTQLTRLELLQLRITDGEFEFESTSFAHLTKIDLKFLEREPLTPLSKLSNLFSLKHLEITAGYSKEGYPTLQIHEAEFLTTLTNLDALIMASLKIPEEVFNKIASIHTQLTQLRINCSESNGEILTRLNNLQVLEFRCVKPMKMLKAPLFEKLTRLTTRIKIRM